MRKPGIVFYLSYYVGIFVLDFFPLLSLNKVEEEKATPKEGSSSSSKHLPQCIV